MNLNDDPSGVTRGEIVITNLVDVYINYLREKIDRPWVAIDAKTKLIIS
jgi:hypothetical protein